MFPASNCGLAYTDLLKPAFVYPYIIAFEPNFIEIRHVDTGALQQVIPSFGLRVLNPSPEIMHCVMDGNGEYQHVFRLREVPRA